MKLTLITAILLILAVSCEDKKEKIEIFENTELEYLTDEEVNTPAVLSVDDWKTENSQIIAAAEKIRTDNKNFPEKISIYFRVFINDEGKITGVKNLRRVEPGLEKINNSLIRSAAEILGKKKISPAIKAGKSVSYRKDLEIGFENNNDSLRIFLPELLVSGRNTQSYDYEKLNESDYFVAVEQMPEPIGGITAIAQKVRYPEIAKRAGIEGRVFVKALIDENGDVAGTSIIKGIGAGCDQAAMNAIMQTKFKPGRQREKAVKVQVTIPIVFKLQ
jgi:TonB family protein